MRASLPGELQLQVFSTLTNILGTLLGDRAWIWNKTELINNITKSKVKVSFKVSFDKTWIHTQVITKPFPDFVLVKSNQWNYSKVHGKSGSASKAIRVERQLCGEGWSHAINARPIVCATPSRLVSCGVRSWRHVIGGRSAIAATKKMTPGGKSGRRRQRWGRPQLDHRTSHWELMCVSFMALRSMWMRPGRKKKKIL